MSTAEQIKEALAKLDVNNDNHWTADGLPKVDTVKLLAKDQSLDRAAITNADPSFSRESAKAAAEAAAQGSQAGEQAGETTGDQGQGTAPAQQPAQGAQGNGSGEPALNNGAPQGDAVAAGSPEGDLPAITAPDGTQVALSADAQGNILAVGQDAGAKLAPQVQTQGGARIVEGTLDSGVAKEEGEEDFDDEDDSTSGQLASLDKEIQGYDEEIRNINAQRTEALAQRYKLSEQLAAEQNHATSHASTVRGYLDAQQREREAEAQRAAKRAELGL